MEVTYTMGRDLEPGKLESVMAALDQWSVYYVFIYPVDVYPRASTTSSVLSALDAQLNAIATENAAHKRCQQEYEKQLQVNLKEVNEKQKEKNLGSVTGVDRGGLGRRGTLQFDRERENMMEVDEIDLRGKGRKFTYVSPTLLKPLSMLSCPSSTQDLKTLRKRNRS